MNLSVVFHSWMMRRRSWLRGCLALVAVGHLFVNMAITGGLLYVSHYNYPGGTALHQLHQIEQTTQGTQGTVYFIYLCAIFMLVLISMLLSTIFIYFLFCYFIPYISYRFSLHYLVQFSNYFTLNPRRLVK